MTREHIAREKVVSNRAENCGWITIHDRAQFEALIRLALNTEVEAGGPYPDET